jgi:hypothetical protein
LGRQKTITVKHDAGFAEKIHLFSEDFLKCISYISETEPARETFTKRLYAKMVSSSKLLEDFLDIHGAKNNSRRNTSSSVSLSITWQRPRDLRGEDMPLTSSL